MADYDYTVKIIFLGEFIVNKRSLLQSLSTLKAEPEVRFLEKSSGMVEMLFVRDGKHVRVKISDTAGQERFRSITTSYYRGVHGCLLLFDVTKKCTFERLGDWETELNRHILTNDVVVALAGCNDHVSGSRDREVTPDQAKQYAEHLDVPYREVNGKEISTLLRVLGEIIDRIINKASSVPELFEGITPMKPRQNRQEQKTRRFLCLW